MLSETFAPFVGLDLERLNSLLYCLYTLIILIIVSQAYTWFVGLFRWIPKFRDVIIPYTIGCAEFILAFNTPVEKTIISKPYLWWFSLAFFGFAGFFGYWNSRFQCKKGILGNNPKAYKRLRSLFLFFMITAAMLSIYSLLMGLIMLPEESPNEFLFWLRKYQVVAFIMPLILAVIVMYGGDWVVEQLLDDYSSPKDSKIIGLDA